MGRFRTEPGLYVADPDDWGSWRRLRPGRPFGRAPHFQPDILDWSLTSGGVRITLRGPRSRDAYVSIDLGRTWRRIAVR